MKTKNYILLLLLIFLSNSMFSQVKEQEIISKTKKGIPKLIRFEETKISSEKKELNKFIKEQFNTNQETEFKQIKKAVIDDLGFQTKKVEQHYNNIKVEYAILNIVSKNGKLKSINGNYIPIQNLNTNPSITEEQALQYALNYIGANEYAWENIEKETLIKRLKKSKTATYYPKGELVIIEKDRYSDNPIPTLAYKFDVYALKPASREYYYIDANSGEVFHTNPIMKHIEGVGATRYSGQRTIETQQVSGQFRLKDNTRGNGITTYNNFNLTSHSNTHYTDNDNNWSAAEYNNANRDNSGLDAHWGSMMTYDYFLQIHNQNSIDNNGYELINYVNADLTGGNWNFPSSDNAFWDGSVMTYGMGTNLQPIVSADVIAHEIGHGLYDKMVGNNDYSREQGAINEGLSDIWGAMVEFFAAPEKDTYLLGEDIGIIIRSMSNPKLRNDPDTYGGDFWQEPNCGIPTRNNDFCGVHTNSGVLNHWFYLLVEGSSATDEINDNGDTFSFSGINKTKASRIIFRAQSVYFTPTTNYSDARNLTIQAAEDLFGKNSAEVFKVKYAWFAVGIGTDPNIGYSNYISGPTQLTPGYRASYSMNAYPDATNYIWSIPSGCHYHYCWGITQGQGTNVLRIKAGKTGRQDITCTIYNGNNVIGSQYITVNVQNPYGGGGGNGDPCGETGGEIPTINGVIYPPDEGDPCGTNSLIASKSFFKHIIVYDLSGRKVIEQKNVESLNINFLPSSIYILKIELSNNKIITKKILK